MKYSRSKMWVKFIIQDNQPAGKKTGKSNEI